MIKKDHGQKNGTGNIPGLENVIEIVTGTGIKTDVEGIRAENAGAQTATTIDAAAVHVRGNGNAIATIGAEVRAAAAGLHRGVVARVTTCGGIGIGTEIVAAIGRENASGKGIARST